MKVIFFGLGSIGQKHAKIILANYSYELFAFRSGVSETPNTLGIKELHSFNEVKNLQADVAFITNPTSLHIETATACAKIGLKLFIEKPIDKDLKGLDKLLKIVKEKKLVTYVAYNLRFHPVIISLKNYIKKCGPLHVRVVCSSFYPLWRADTDYLKSYSANSSMGGGVILDLSHELDYVYYLLGPINNIQGNFSKRSKVTVDAEDYADFIIETKTGPANIHINFFSHSLQRYTQIDFDSLTIIGDIINSEITEFKNEKLKKKIKLDYYKDLSYEKQIKYFFDNIDNPKMMNNLFEAEALFRKIIKFKQIHG